MSTLRTNDLALSARSRGSAYVALTKPDVSFLVLATTAAGPALAISNGENKGRRA